MEDQEAIIRFGALTAPSRLAVIRVLAEAGPDGIASGAIATKLKVQPNTVSTQLLLLSNARIVQSKRIGRAIIYSLRMEAEQELGAFLHSLWLTGDRQEDRSIKRRA